MLRGVVVGARRKRQGTGPFVARALVAAGAEVAAVVGTSEATVAAAQEGLPPCAGYVDLAEALRSEAPDFVALCTPYPAHAAQLEVVAAEGCHCLCEKPLWWSAGADHAAGTASIVDAFVTRERLLAVLTQWPYTLPSFFALHPGVVPEAVARFSMRLGPMSVGPEMVLDAAPHALSLLERLLGSAAVTDAEASWRGAHDLTLRFGYAHAAATCRFVTAPTPPRPAAYGINGREIARSIRQPGYHQVFEADGRSIEVPDPLSLLVRDFLRNCDTGVGTDRAGLIQSMTNLEALFEAAS